MRIGGLLLLLSGWAIVLTAIAILASGGARIGFILTGVVVEIAGLTLVFKSYQSHEEGRR